MCTNTKERGKPFQQGTSDVMARRYWLIMVPASLVMGLIVGVEVAWLSGNWLLFPLFAIVTSLNSFALACFFVKDIRPTLTCRSCGAYGWIADLALTDGTCSHCSGTQYDYARWYVQGPNIPHKITHRDVSGKDLLELRGQNGLKYI